MFNLFSKTKKADQTQLFQSEIIRLLEDFKQELSSHKSPQYALAIQRIEECLAEIRQPEISILKIALRVKWLIREIGMMLFDKQFTLTATEEEIWWCIKECNGKSDNIGHGVGLGL